MSDEERRNRVYEVYLWVRTNLLPAGIIAGIGFLGGHFEAYIGFGYRISALENKVDKMDTDSRIEGLQSQVQGLQALVQSHEARLNIAESESKNPPRKANHETNLGIPKRIHH